MLFEKQLLRWFHTIGGQCRNDVLLCYVLELHLCKNKKINKIKLRCLRRSTVLPTPLYNVKSYREFQLVVHRDLLQLGHLYNAKL